MIGIVFNNSILFSRSPKLKRQKALFLPERQLVKDSAVLIKQNGEKIKGTLVLTYEHLIFLGNGKKEIKMEKEVREIHSNSSKTKFLGMPEGFQIENGDILLKVSFPQYWFNRINEQKIETAS